MKSTEITVTSDAETELLVAEEDERRPLRQESRSYVDDVTKTEAYRALVEQLDQLPMDGEILSTPVQGW